MFEIMAQYVILGVLKLTEDLPASQSAGIKGAPATTLSPYYIFNHDLFFSRSSQLSFYRLHVEITIISLTVSTVLAILLIPLSMTFHLSVLCYILV